jgi:hypothetical protein
MRLDTLKVLDGNVWERDTSSGKVLSDKLAQSLCVEFGLELFEDFGEF